MSAVSTAGAVHLARLLYSDTVASVHTGMLSDTRTPVVVTLAHERVDGAAREVFLDWGARLTQLSAHPHVAPIAAFGLTESARPYVAVQAVRTTLADELRESGPPPAGQVRALGVALASTLDTIHSTGLIHGALQPATVLSGPGRKLMVAGFDATAPVLAHALPVGPYTAPEHLEAANAGSVYASPAADVYNLATLLYAALGGEVPWAKRGDVSDRVLRAAPLPDIPGVSIALTDVLANGMHVEPKQRPSAKELRELLSNIDISQPIAPGDRPRQVCVDLVPKSGPRPTPLPGGADVALRPKPPKPRRRWWLNPPAKLALVAMCTLIAIGGVGLFAFAATTAEAEYTCPTREHIASVVDEVYKDMTVADSLCGDNGYVAVIAEVTGPGESRLQSQETATMVLHRTKAGEIEVVYSCASEVPVRLRSFLECPREAMTRLDASLLRPRNLHVGKRRQGAVGVRAGVSGLHRPVPLGR